MLVENAPSIQPIIGEIDRAEVLVAAKKFIDANSILWNVDSEDTYSSIDDRGVRIPSDFKLLYWKNGANVPESIRSKVARKVEKVILKEENKLRMCCWDFCYLVLCKANLITEEQMNDIIHIGAVSKQIDPLLSLPFALIDGDWANSNSFTDSSYPSPGDIALVKYRWEEIEKIGHVMINSGPGTFYELDDNLGVKDFNADRFLKYNLQSYRWVSLQDVPKNIAAFIDRNRHLLPASSEVLFSDRMLKGQLRNSKYSKLFPLTLVQ